VRQVPGVEGDAGAGGALGAGLRTGDTGLA